MSKQLSQAERLEKREVLRSAILKLEAQIRDLHDEEQALLEDCAHTYANGQSAVIGGRTKVCVHCGRVVVAKEDKLWG